MQHGHATPANVGPCRQGDFDTPLSGAKHPEHAQCTSPASLLAPLSLRSFHGSRCGCTGRAAPCEPQCRQGQFFSGAAWPTLAHGPVCRKHQCINAPLVSQVKVLLVPVAQLHTTPSSTRVFWPELKMKKPLRIWQCITSSNNYGQWFHSSHSTGFPGTLATELLPAS